MGLLQIIALGPGAVVLFELVWLSLLGGFLPVCASVSDPLYLPFWLCTLVAVWGTGLGC